MKYPALKTNLKNINFKIHHTLFVLERKWRCHPLLSRFYPQKAIYRRLLAVFLALLLLIPSVFIFLRPHQAAAVWFDDSYAYRQQITFDHDADLADASMRLTINTSALSGKIRSDCFDSRFTDNDGKVLRFRLVSACGTTSTIYDVIFPTVVNGTNLAYFYYGKPSAASASDSSVPTGTAPSGTPSFASEEKAPSPALYLKFDEGTGDTAHDSSGNNNNGSMGTTWKTKESCLSDNCVYFDGR